MSLVNDLIANFGSNLKEKLQDDASKRSVLHEQFLEVYLDYLMILLKIYTIFAWANQSFSESIPSACLLTPLNL